MLEPKPRIAPRPLALQPLVDAQDGIDSYIAVRMNSDLPVSLMSLACLALLAFWHVPIRRKKLPKAQLFPV